jgi:hypothetical protein
MPSALGGGYAGVGYASKSYGGKLPDSGGAPQTVTIGGAASAESVSQPQVIQIVKPIAFSEAAFGLYSTSVTVPNIGGIAPGQPGSPRINRTVPMEGIGSGETFPNPVVTQTQYRTPLGISGFAAGLLHTSVTVPMRGAAPSEAFGGVLIGRSFLLGSISSAETVSTPTIAYLFRMAGTAPGDFGLFSTSVSVPMRGVLSQQAAGMFFAHVTVPMIGVVSAELVEQPFSVGVIVALVAISPTFDTGNPIVAPGPLSVHTSGVPPGETFGEVRLHGYMLMQGIGSAEAVPPFAAVRTQRHLIAALSDEAIGNPTIPVRPTPAITGAGAGLPLVSVNITSRPAGLASSGSVGAPIVGAVIAPQGIASAETVTELPRVVVPAGFTGEAFGLPRVSLPVADQTLAVAGAPSSEAFGPLAVRTFTVVLAGVVPGVVGAPFLNRQLRVPGFSAGAVGVPGVRSFVIDLTGAGVASGEAVGRPSFPAPQWVQMGPGAPSGEAAGEPTWTRGVVFYLIGVPSGETILGPSFGFGGVNRNMQGLDARGPVSPVGWAQDRQVASVPSGETFGSPQVANVILPIGAVSQAAVGRPERPVFGPVARGPAGIGSREAFGPLHYKQTIAPVGVLSAPVGAPTVKATFIVPPAGTESSEAFGDPALSITVLLGGTGSAEVVSQFSVVIFVPVEGVASREAVSEPPPPAYIEHPAGVDSVEDAGLPTTVQIVAVGGIGSLEQAGAPNTIQTALLSSIEPDEAVSPVTVGVLVGVEGIGSAETVSGIVTNLEERPAGIGSAEALGGFVVHVTIPLEGATSAEQAGLPAIPSVTVHMVGIASAAVVPGANTNLTVPVWGISEYPFEPHVSKLGQPRVTATVFGGQPVGVPTGEAVGQPRQAAQAVRPVGATSHQALGQLGVPGQLVRMAGTASGFRTAGPSAGQRITIFAGGIGTAEQVGRPGFPAAAVRVGGVSPQAAAGRPTVHVLERVQGAASSARLGFPTTVQFLRPVGAGSLEAAGQPKATQREAIGSVPSGEQAGRPRTAVTVPIGGAQPGQVGAPQFRTSIFVLPGPAGQGGPLGEPGISTAVQVRLGAISSTEASGWPLLVIEPVLLLPVGIVSEEAVRLSFVGGIFLVPFQLDTSVSTVAQSVTLRSRSLRVEVLPVTLAPDTIDEQLTTITAAEAEAIDVVQRAAAVIAGTPTLETEARVRTLHAWLEQVDSATVTDARQADTDTEERDTTTAVTPVVAVRDYPPPIGGNT